MGTTVVAEVPNFGQALSAFKRVIDAPRVRVVERVQSLPLAVAVATILGAVK